MPRCQARTRTVVRLGLSAWRSNERSNAQLHFDRDPLPRHDGTGWEPGSALFGFLPIQEAPMKVSFLAAVVITATVTVATAQSGSGGSGGGSGTSGGGTSSSGSLSSGSSTSTTNNLGVLGSSGTMRQPGTNEGSRAVTPDRDAGRYGRAGGIGDPSVGSSLTGSRLRSAPSGLRGADPGARSRPLRR